MEKIHPALGRALAAAAGLVFGFGGALTVTAPAQAATDHPVPVESTVECESWPQQGAGSPEHSNPDCSGEEAEELPVTGSQGVVLGGVAVTFLTLGSGMYLLTRRRGFVFTA